MGGTRRQSLNLVSDVRPDDSSIIACSLAVRGGKPPQCFYRWDVVIGPTDRRRISGQGITDAILCTGHTSEHAGQALLVAAEADEHRPMRSHRPERGVAAEDVLLYPLLFDRRARDVRRFTADLPIYPCTPILGPPHH